MRMMDSEFRVSRGVAFRSDLPAGGRFVNTDAPVKSTPDRPASVDSVLVSETLATIWSAKVHALAFSEILLVSRVP